MATFGQKAYWHPLPGNTDAFHIDVMQHDDPDDEETIRLKIAGRLLPNMPTAPAKSKQDGGELLHNKQKPKNSLLGCGDRLAYKLRLNAWLPPA